MIQRLLLTTAVLGLVSCTGTPPRDIAELVVEDSTYVDPVTETPYTGPVFKRFPTEEDGIQVEAVLVDGTWEGELTVYHSTGRIRYQGEMSKGAQCGGWVENDAAVAPESAYEAIKEDLESLVMYASCPDG